MGPRPRRSGDALPAAKAALASFVLCRGGGTRLRRNENACQTEESRSGRDTAGDAMVEWMAV